MAELSWFDFPAQDAARAQTFYSELFGWQFDRVEGFDYYMIGGDAPIGGMYPAPSAPRGITVYFKGLLDLGLGAGRRTRMLLIALDVKDARNPSS